MNQPLYRSKWPLLSIISIIRNPKGTGVGMPMMVIEIPGKATFAPANGAIIPAIVADAGDYAARRFLEFFAAFIRNKHTR